MDTNPIVDQLSTLQAESPLGAIHHLATTLLTSILMWLTIYNAHFDPLRLRPPKSLTLSVLLIPLSVINTRFIGQGKWHFTSFEVAPFFNTSFSAEIMLSIAVLALAAWRSGSGGWADVALRVLPLYFALLQYLAVTPFLLNSKKQVLILYIGALLDTGLYVLIPVWGAAYGCLLAWRVVLWGIMFVFRMLRWVGGSAGLL